MTKPIETFTLTRQQYNAIISKEVEEGSELCGITHSKYYILDALDNYVFIRTRDRAKAQAWVDEEYGKGKYRVRTHVQDGVAAGEASCRATETRRCQAKYRSETFGVPVGVR